MKDRAEELVLSQAIAQALKHFEERQPDRLQAFVVDLMRYERRLWMMGLSDRAVRPAVGGGPSPPAGFWRMAGLAVTAPIALYGWAHRLAPVWFVEWAVEKFSPRENVRAQVAHASMIAGLVGFGVLYAAAAIVMWRLGGAAWALAYLVSLPVTGPFAHAWIRSFARVGGQIRAAWLMGRLPLTRRHLARMRARLIADIDAFRADYRRDVLKLPSS
jgi:hypothetical protein